MPKPVEVCGCEESVALRAEVARLREALERIAGEGACDYGNGASCLMLPRGVKRSVCNPCYARAALSERGA